MRAWPRMLSQEAASCVHCLAFRSNTWALRLRPHISKVLNDPVIQSLDLLSLSGFSPSLECQRQRNKNKALIPGRKATCRSPALETSVL
ncbi:mCG147275 [Mus musculus]|nr:mCG147275 [Mus musculus]